MNFIDHIKPENIILNLEELSIKKLAEQFTKLVLSNSNVDDVSSVAEEIVNRIIGRQKLGSTAIGNGVALMYPDNYSANFIKEPVIVIGISKKGIKWFLEDNPDKNTSLDDKPVHIIYYELVPVMDNHIKLIAGFCRIVRDKNIYNKLINAENPSEVVNVLKENK